MAKKERQQEKTQDGHREEKLKVHSKSEGKWGNKKNGTVNPPARQE